MRLGKNRTSIAMSQLVERHIVLRPEGRYRSYFIHPYFAGYAGEQEMYQALREATEAIQAGELPAPALPAPQRHLAAGPTRRSAQPAPTPGRTRWTMGAGSVRWEAGPELVVRGKMTAAQRGGVAVGRWWWVGSLESGTPARVAGRRWVGRLRPMPKDQQELVLREWAVLRERLRRHASARLADAGDALRAGELDLPQGSAGARDHSWALDAYQAAGKLLDEAVDLPDLAAVVVPAERAVERLAVARARGAGVRLGALPVRCFYNPLHSAARPPEPVGKSSRRRVSARRAAADRRPACASCHRALLAGRQPDVLPALLRVRASFGRIVPVLVPYYLVPQQSSPWSATACGAYGDDAPGLVMSGGHRTRPVTRH